MRPSVGIVALNDADEVALVTQWRYPLGRMSVEIPTSGSEASDPGVLAAARRELREETGLTARSWRELGFVDNSNVRPAGLKASAMRMTRATSMRRRRPGDGDVDGLGEGDFDGLGEGDFDGLAEGDFDTSGDGDGWTGDEHVDRGPSEARGRPRGGGCAGGRRGRGGRRTPRGGPSACLGSVGRCGATASWLGRLGICGVRAGEGEQRNARSRGDPQPRQPRRRSPFRDWPGCWPSSAA